MSEVTVSKQYRYAVSERYKDRLENRITEQELRQHLDELNEEEAKRKEEHSRPLLIRNAVTMGGEDGGGRGLVAFTGVIATIAGGLLTTFKLQDRIYANHKAVAELRLECQKYDYHIDEYKDLGPAEAFIKFSRAVNLIQGEQMLQEVKLWNLKGEEGKKVQPEIKADQQREEEESEKARDAEILEEREPEEPFAEDGESDEKQHEGISSSSENASLR